MKQSKLVIRLTPLSCETGLWCDRCLVPAAYRVTFVTECGGTIGDLQHVTGCYDCEAS